MPSSLSALHAPRPGRRTRSLLRLTDLGLLTHPTSCRPCPGSGGRRSDRSPRDAISSSIPSSSSCRLPARRYGVRCARHRTPGHRSLMCDSLRRLGGVPMNERAALDHGSVPSGVVSPARSGIPAWPAWSCRTCPSARCCTTRTSPASNRSRSRVGSGSRRARASRGFGGITSPWSTSTGATSACTASIPEATRRFGDRATARASARDDRRACVSRRRRRLAGRETARGHAFDVRRPRCLTASHRHGVARPGPGRGDASPGHPRVGVSRCELLPRFEAPGVHGDRRARVRGSREGSDDDEGAYLLAREPARTVEAQIGRILARRAVRRHRDGAEREPGAGSR